MTVNGKWLNGLLVATALTFMPTTAAWSQTPPTDPPGQTAPVAQPADAAVQLPQPTAPDDMFIEFVVPTHRIYLGEYIRVQYNVYVAASRGQVYYENAEPDFLSFAVYEDKTPRADVAIIDGKRYTREPFATYFVSPIKTGSLDLPQLSVNVPFHNPVNWITHARHIVEVLPPPEPFPALFDLHNVGEVSLIDEIPEIRRAPVGQPFTYKVHIISNTSTANMVIHAPTTRQNTPFEGKIRFYPPRKLQTIEKVVDDKFVSETIYEFMIVPLTQGHYDFLPVELVSFNPSTQKYEHLKTEGFHLVAIASDFRQSSLENTNTILEIDGLKPRPIHIPNHKKPPYLPTFLMWLPPIVFAIFFGGKFVRSARKQFQKNKDASQHREEVIENFLKETETTAQLSLLRELLEMAFDQSFSRISHLDIQLLRESGLNTNQALCLTDYYDTLAQASYSGHPALTPKECEEVIQILKDLKPRETP